MENRSPYVLVGALVMAFIVGIAGFLTWKLRAGSRDEVAYYEIFFGNDVQGLTKDSAVFYRGIRVGRVQSISLRTRDEPRRSDGQVRPVEKIAVVVAIDRSIDIRDRSYATFERPFVAGAAFVQIVGRPDDTSVKPKKQAGELPYPEIREVPSLIQATSMTLEEALPKIAGIADRINNLLSPETIAATERTVQNLGRITDAIARNDKAIEKTIAELPETLADMRRALAKAEAMVDSASLVLAELGPQDEATRRALAGRAPGELKQSVAALREALASVNGAAGGLNKMLGDSRGAVRQFSEGGLSELAAAVRELRALVAGLNAISTRLERDPAGYLLGGKQGYSPR
ncbi:MAG: MCE family protein [Rhodospirillales bacterium]|nr:MCE family protein [Rhodospirillales bacterium]QQS13128.1 MAG: MCE family protein [Rhodospirillales bacterium]